MKNELTIFLVDDERNNREVISELIERIFIDLRIVGEAASVNEAFEKNLRFVSRNWFYWTFKCHEVTALLY